MARRSDLGGQRGGWLGALALGVALTLAACGGHGARDYTVRGRIEQLPSASEPGSELMIAHEALDDFVDREGKMSGMDSMTMSYPLARGVETAGLAAGDPVELELHVDWSADRPAEITRLKKLPPGTPIVFRAARPPK
jgi:hypothetical protein